MVIKSMKKLRLYTLLLTSCAMLIPSLSSATFINLYDPDAYDGSGSGVNDVEIRYTLFQSLNDVTVTQLGMVFDPYAAPSIDVQFQVFESDSDFNFGSVMLDVTSNFTDIGMATYGVDTSLSLLSDEYYILAFNPLGFTFMPTMRLSQTTTPFTTEDSNFNVLDFAQSYEGAFITTGTVPAFRLNTGERVNLPIAGLPTDPPTSVPEPSIIWLLGSGLALIGFARRKA